MKKIWCVIPVYNNAMTVHTVVRQCLRELPDVLVVDDGSTDTDLAAFYASSRVTVLRNETNRGKGAAIRRAAEYLASLGADYMITLDADGQHFPEDIRTFLPLFEANEHAVIVGCRDFNTENVPESSRFGRSFANFWMRVETGVPVDDCQSGFRAYPVKYIVQLNCISDRYGYETELLTRSAWAGLDILCVPVRVCYPPQGKRISHFRPWLDNFRLSCLHTHLVGLRLLPYPKKKLVKREVPLSIFRPKELFTALLKENATPEGLASSAAVGTFLAVLPIPGFHIAAIVYFTQRFHLNKIMALLIQHLFMPPLSPFLCIELGHYFMHRRWLTALTFRTVVIEMPHRLWEWFLGSLLLAPFWAVAIWFATFAAVKFFKQRKERKEGGRA